MTTQRLVPVSSPSIELQSQILLEEYKVIREMVAKHSEWQAQLDTLALAGLGGAITLVLAFVNQTETALGVLLLLPIVFFAIAFVQLRHERLMTLSAIYIDCELRPKLEHLTGRLLGEKISILGYERYLARHTWSRGLLLEWFATSTHAALSLVIGLGIIAVHFYMRAVMLPDLALRGYQVWLLVVDILLLTGDLAIAFLIAHIRHKHNKKQYPKAKM